MQGTEDIRHFDITKLIRPCKLHGYLGQGKRELKHRSSRKPFGTSERVVNNKMLLTE